MTKKSFIIFLVIFATIFGLAGVVKAEQYAVLVGVSEYLEENTLPSAPNDAEALRDVLLHIGYLPENIVCLTSGANLQTLPIKSTIEIKIKEILAKAKPGDTVIIFLTGHGLEVKGQPQFCPSDTRKGSSLDDLMSTTVSINDILKSFQSCRATFKLMIVDACRSGGGLPAGVLPMPPLVSPTPGVMLMQSCAAGQSSVEYGALKHGAFTYALLEGLCGKAADSDGDVSLLNLIAYTTKRTQQIAKDFSRHEQTPTMLGNITDFIFVSKSKTDSRELDQLLEVYRKERDRIERERAEALADARKYVDAEIKNLIETELKNANLEETELDEKIIAHITATIKKNAILQANLGLLFSACSSDEEMYKLQLELINVPVNKAYRDALIAEGKKRTQAREETEKLQDAIADFEKAYTAALATGDYNNIARLSGVRLENTFAGVLLTHVASGTQKFVPYTVNGKEMANYPTDGSIYDKAMLANLAGRDMNKKDAAFVSLRKNDITVKTVANGEHEFYYGELKIENVPREVRGLGKCLEAGVEPTKYNKLLPSVNAVDKQ